MKNRVPKYPGRVKLTPVPGSSDLFDLERADEPTDPGTPLNKATFLTDETARALTLDPANDPTVDDALLILRALSGNLAFVRLSVRTANGNPAPAGIPISGAQNPDGSPYVTTGNAVDLVTIQAGSVTLTSSAYADLQAKSTVVEASAGSILEKEFVLPAAQSGEQAFSTTGSLKLSPFASELDICCVGGGGGGGNGHIDSADRFCGGSGGGGGYCTNTFNIPAQSGEYVVTVGAGGDGGTNATNNEGKDGGESSVYFAGNKIATALGGKKGRYVWAATPRYPAAEGNGPGGLGEFSYPAVVATSGSPGTVYRFNETSRGLVSGGGAGITYGEYNGKQTGGNPYGGNKASAGRGPGGGGGGNAINQKGGEGYRGEVTVRWRVRGEL